MDAERIERALRDGPPDEPAYFPGAFRRPPRRGLWLAVAGPALGVALAVGLVVGAGLPTLRDGGIGAQPDPVAIAEALQGSSWDSTEIPLQTWVDALIQRGFTIDEVTAFLEHDSFESTARYRLMFGADQLVIQAVYDGAVPVTLSGGPYTIGADGTIEYFDANSAQPGEGCGVTASITLSGATLATDLIDLERCADDETLAMTAILDLVPYVRRDP